MEDATLLDRRLLIVSGKGGTGKSTVAAALAVAGARSGRRTALVELEGRQAFARLLDTEPWGFAAREYRPGLWGLSIDPEASLGEYLERFYGGRRLSRLLASSAAAEFATAVAPGVKDLLLIGKVMDLERARDLAGRFRYDLLVVDAPPTGRITSFLRAPEVTTELVGVGPIREQAQQVVDLLGDGRRTHVQLVTLLEEMPVSETIAGATALEALGVTLGPVLVNRVLPGRFDAESRKALTEDLGSAEVAAILADAGIDVGAAAAADLRALGLRQLHRLELQERMRALLARSLQLARLELPDVHSDEFGPREVAELARRVQEAVA
ncbi:MAG TPA: ArsA-related P-loop ATPase [Egibacteraceae bacterium]|nr:ArsA-related P-loop ATPase [Egibacteraceae bacterium]